MDNSHNGIQLVNVSKAWARPLWDLWEKHLDVIPKTWPKSETEFHKWVLSRNTGQNYPVTCMIVTPMGDEFEIAGVISADLVTVDNYEKYQGAPIGDVNLSYMTFEGFRGRGLAGQAVNALSEAVLFDGRFPVLRIAPQNIPSQNVAEQCGFRMVERIEPDDPCQFTDRVKLQVFRHPRDPLTYSNVRNLLTRPDLDQGNLFRDVGKSPVSR